MDLPADAAKDQSNVPNGYYRKNTGMLHMLAASNTAQFTPVDLTDDELRTLAIKKLSIALQAIDPVLQPEMTRKLCAEVKDRLDGKPGQAVELTGRNGGAIEVVAASPVEIARRVAFLLAGAVVDAEFTEIK